MKTSIILALALVGLMAPGARAQGTPRFTGHSFTPSGAFHVAISGPAEVEASNDLQTWSKFASVSQEAGLEDLASRRAEQRFYRLNGGRGMASVAGYIKVTVPPGKLVILGNTFDAPIRLDTPDGRLAAFGMTNPPVKVSLYTNSNFVPHTFEANAGNWNPPLRAIKAREGFAVQNVGTAPVTVRMGGVLRDGEFKMSYPAGASLVVPANPKSGPMLQVVALPGQDGLQVNWFNEDTQSYVVSSFDNLDGAWTPKLPDYRAGRAFVIKSKDPVSWTDKFSAAAK